jgi:hypothetical protein
MLEMRILAVMVVWNFGGIHSFIYVKHLEELLAQFNAQ